MRTDTTQLVQQSWSLVLPIAPQAAALFYANLFQRDPSLQRMFRGDMQQQGRRLMQMIGLAVQRLDDLDGMLSTLREMGQRHTGYGVRRVHYDTMGAALLETLAQVLGQAFTDELALAWAEAYAVLAGAMYAGNQAVEAGEAGFEKTAFEETAIEA